MILDYYIGELREIVNKVTDETKIDDRLLIRWLNSQRALWIKNQVNKEYVISDSVVQSIRCLPLDIASAAECEYLDSNSKFLVSHRIPKVLEFKDRLGLIDIRVAELLGYSLSIVSRDELKYVGNGRYNTQDIYCTLYNSKIYIKIPENNFKVALLTNVTIDAIFENPLEVSSFECCSGEPCFNKDKDDYPISDALWEYMQGAIVQNKMLFKLQIPDKDENNDNNES